MGRGQNASEWQQKGGVLGPQGDEGGDVGGKEGESTIRESRMPSKLQSDRAF